MKDRNSIVNDLANLLEKLALQTERVLSQNQPSKLDIDLAKEHLRRIYDAFDEYEEFTHSRPEGNPVPEPELRVADTVFFSESETPRHSEPEPPLPPRTDIFAPAAVENIDEPEITEFPELESAGPEIIESPVIAPEPVYRPEPVREPIELEVPDPVEPDIPAPAEEFPESQDQIIKPGMEAWQAAAPAAEPAPEPTSPAVQIPVLPEPAPEARKSESLPTASLTSSFSAIIYEKMLSGRTDQSIGSRLQRRKISDLRKAIGINEKFQFSKDLFGGSINLYEQAVNRLNDAGGFTQACSVLDEIAESRNWSADDTTLLLFIEFIERRHLSEE